MEYPIQVFAVVMRDDEILATLHDRGLGAFWGLPAEWVQRGDSIRTVVENVVLNLTMLTVEAGRLLAAEYIFDTGHASLLLAFECTLKGDITAVFQGTDDVSDASITDCGWIKMSNFMRHSIPLFEWNFWIRAIQAKQGEIAVDLHETDADTTPR